MLTQKQVEVLLKPCQIHQGALNWGGYGVIRRMGRNWLRHRWEYTQVHGPIPDGLQLDHLCKVTACFEVSHLEAVTPAENTRRSTAGQKTGAQHAARTHCPKGHAYDEVNTYRPPGNPNHRMCKACGVESRRNQRASAKKVTT